MNKLLLKKIRLHIAAGQAVLHLSSKDDVISDEVSAANNFLKLDKLDDLANYGLAGKKKIFTHVIADMDSPELDDFDGFLNAIAPLIIRPGSLIIVASNLCTDLNKLQFFFGNAPENFDRPCRAIPPKYLRDKLLEHGYFPKNRLWQYDEKILAIADTPINS